MKCEGGGRSGEEDEGMYVWLESVKKILKRLPFSVVPFQTFAPKKRIKIRVKTVTMFYNRSPTPTGKVTALVVGCSDRGLTKIYKLYF